ncbi:hypothetical protein [Dietzia sp. 179-F 9C3 NHS]
MSSDSYYEPAWVNDFDRDDGGDDGYRQDRHEPDDLNYFDD